MTVTMATFVTKQSSDALWVVGVIGIAIGIIPVCRVSVPHGRITNVLAFIVIVMMMSIAARATAMQNSGHFGNGVGTVNITFGVLCAM